MEQLFPKSFIESLAGCVCLAALILVIVSLFSKDRSFVTRIFGLMFIFSISLFSNHWSTYFASIFIIATTITELEFLERLAAIIRGSKHYFDFKKAEAGSAKTPLNQEPPERRTMEYKILNTLWTKQVNKYPDYSKVFTFRINANSSEYLEFREASSKLIGEGLISETESGQIYITKKGFEYCKQHHEKFPPEQWWPEETINHENLEKVLQAA